MNFNLKSQKQLIMEERANGMKNELKGRDNRNTR